MSFLKLGLVLVGLTGVCQIFLESQHSQIAVFEAVCFDLYRLEWNGPRTNPYVKFSLVSVCVLTM